MASLWPRLLWAQPRQLRVQPRNITSMPQLHRLPPSQWQWPLCLCQRDHDPCTHCTNFCLKSHYQSDTDLIDDGCAAMLILDFLYIIVACSIVFKSMEYINIISCRKCGKCNISTVIQSHLQSSSPVALHCHVVELELMWISPCPTTQP